jgi:hypothetical protein
MQRPFQIIDTTGTVHFDGLQAVTWKVLMRRTISTMRITNIAPGQLYSFIFVQDGIGGHQFVWPTPQVTGGMLIDIIPNATSIQNFVGGTGSTLDAIAPGAWR